LINDLLLNLSFIFFEQAKAARILFLVIKPIWRVRQLRFGFHCYLKTALHFLYSSIWGLRILTAP